MLVVGQKLLIDPMPGIEAEGVETLHVPALAIKPWARFIAGKSYAYLVAVEPVRAVGSMTPASLDAKEQAGDE